MNVALGLERAVGVRHEVGPALAEHHLKIGGLEADVVVAVDHVGRARHAVPWAEDSVRPTGRTGHMYSPKQFCERADELGDLASVTDDRPRGSSARCAIDAWENEGGGSAEAFGDAARTALADIAGWRENNNAGWLANNFAKTSPTSDKDGAPTLTFADEEDGILRCLGAAVIMRWNTIPTKLQRELFDSASSVGDLLQTGALKGQIARFLHKHKDDQG